MVEHIIELGYYININGNSAHFTLAEDDANKAFVLFVDDCTSVDTSNVIDWINYKFPGNSGPSQISIKDQYQVPEGVDIILVIQLLIGDDCKSGTVCGAALRFSFQMIEKCDINTN